MPSKTREEIVRECAEAVASCWVHYSDECLTQLCVKQVERYLLEVLPESVSTEQWEAYAEQYRKEVEESEEEECHCGGRLGWYSPDNGQWVSCMTCPDGIAESERIEKLQRM